MTAENLKSAIQSCDDGLLEFNNGIVRSFLYGKCWYPLRATVNRARFEAGQDELNTDRCLVELVYLLPYIKVEDREFNNSFPIKINDGDKFREISYLSEMIKKMTS